MSRFLSASTAIAALVLGACAADFGLAKDEPVRLVSPEENAHLDELKVKAVAINETNRLNHLATLAIDAGKLYGEAAAKVDNPELRAEVETAASSHREFAAELQGRVTALGGEPVRTGDPANTLGLTFGDTRALEDTNLSAANQVSRVETYLIGELGLTLDTGLSGVSKDLVEAELNDTKQALGRLEAMRTRIVAERAAETAASEDAAEDDEESPG